jgi:hypothetical protein
MDRKLEQHVWERAQSCCEYCQLPADVAETPFQVDHIIARKHGGRTESLNLSLSCFYCNSYKGPNLSGIDRESGKLTRLFHPREDDWNEHFRWNGAVLFGLTDVGRATIAVLNINHPAAMAKREELIQEGVFPPDLR